MSQLEDLIQTFCPNGVEYSAMKDCCVMRRGESVTKNSTNEGPIPVIAGGQRPAYFIDKANRTGDTIVVSSSGAYAGYVSYWNNPIFVSDAFSIEAKKGICLKFLFHFLKNRQESIHSLKKGGGVPHVHVSDLAPMRIPLPPLPVQEEIVRILDTFSGVVMELEQNLEAELAARVRQYEHYRNELLSFDSNSKIIERIHKNSSGLHFEYKPLREVSNIFIGSFVKKTEHDVSYQYPVYNGGVDPTGYYSKSNSDKNSVVISSRGANCGFVNFLTVDFWAGNSCYVIKNLNSGVAPKFLYYFLKANQDKLFALRQTSGIPAINSEPLGKFKIPLLPLQVQEQIVSILDRFDTLVNDLKSGLPAEIALRRKQYEYYRDKLLTFQPLK